jgi:hypothetical protein
VRRFLFSIVVVAVTWATAVASATCPTFSSPMTQTATDSNPDAAEVSGLLASSQVTNLIWMEGDSGQGAHLWATNRNGDDLGTITISGATNTDWEDMSFGPNGDIFICDCGDNAVSRSNIVIYRIHEPDVSLGDQTVALVNTYTMTYPDGAHNAETFIMKSTGRMWIIAKNSSGTLYQADLGDSSFTNEGSTNLSTTTGDDFRVQSNGDAALVVESAPLGYAKYWDVTTNVRDALLNVSPCSATAYPYDPPNGKYGSEAMALKPNLSGYYMVDEGSNPDINWVDVTH